MNKKSSSPNTDSNLYQEYSVLVTKKMCDEIQTDLNTTLYLT